MQLRNQPAQRRSSIARKFRTSANSDRAQAFTNAYLAEFQKKFDADAVTGQLVGIYDQHFTDDEIRGCWNFTVPAGAESLPPKCRRSAAKHK